jgi:hypothetical protein
MAFLPYHRLLILFFFLLRLVVATAQPLQTASGLTYHPIRTINPADPDLADLAFLKQAIGPARVVFLDRPWRKPPPTCSATSQIPATGPRCSTACCS